MGRLGTLTLQAMDDCDLFIKEDVYLDGVTEFTDSETQLDEPGFGERKAWISGMVPAVIPVSVDGDTSVIIGWFRTDVFASSFYLKIYIEFEEADEQTEP